MRTNVPPARKCRNSSARKVVAGVQDKATQAVGPAQADDPVKVDDPVKMAKADAR